jgi:hypothetical protein
VLTDGARRSLFGTGTTGASSLASGRGRRLGGRAIGGRGVGDKVVPEIRLGVPPPPTGVGGMVSRDGNGGPVGIISEGGASYMSSGPSSL